MSLKPIKLLLVLWIHMHRHVHQARCKLVQGCARSQFLLPTGNITWGAPVYFAPVVWLRQHDCWAAFSVLYMWLWNFPAWAVSEDGSSHEAIRTPYSCNPAILSHHHRMKIWQDFRPLQERVVSCNSDKVTKQPCLQIHVLDTQDSASLGAVGLSMWT